MRLIGSKTEKELREQLNASKYALFNSEEKKRLLEIIKKSFPEMKSACIISGIPEQESDIYQILINDQTVSTIEISKNNYDYEPLLVEAEDIAHYLKGRKKQAQITLAIALELVREDLQRIN